jgi:glycine hydroxymethyltransferase
MILCKKDLAAAIDKAIFPGTQGGPLMHIIAAKAVCFKEAATPSFKEYQKQIISNAAAMADALMQRGFQLVSGGTDNHLMLIDLRNKGITGKYAEERLDSIGITVNKNAVPFDTEKPFITSGMRIGTPAVTSRGMKETQMSEIADIIAGTLSDDNADLEALKARVSVLCAQFPLYEGVVIK